MALHDGARLKSLGQCCRTLDNSLCKLPKLAGILLANFSYLATAGSGFISTTKFNSESLGNLVIGLHEGVFIDKLSQEDFGDNESEAGNLKDMVKDKASAGRHGILFLTCCWRDRVTELPYAIKPSPRTNMIDAQAVPVRMILA